MKKIIVLFLMAMTVSYCFAQEDGGQRRMRGPREFSPEQMAQRQADRIKEVCGINDEQYAKLKEHFKVQSEAMQKAFQNRADQQRMSREEMEKLREEGEKEVKQILTEEQYAKYQEMQKKIWKRAFNGPRNGNRRFHSNRPPVAPVAPEAPEPPVAPEAPAE